MGQSLPVPTIQSEDGASLLRLTYANERDAPFRWNPARLQVALDLAPWRALLPPIDSVQLELPSGWRCEGDSWRSLSGLDSVVWIVTPLGVPETFPEKISAVALTAAVEATRSTAEITVEIRGYSQFDPQRDELREANSVSVLGKIGPERPIFERTFRLAPARNALFDGLYRSIVFIGGDGQGYQGGLCSGMARAALQRSLTGHGPEPAIGDIILWHGRQLTDRALLASAPWFLAPSPRRAYRRFRSLILSTGKSDLCFDIAVPRPLRRDLATALMEEGHTVVPYAFIQSNEGRAEVLVYDPNHPEPEAAQQSVMVFDLDKDRYAYRQLARLEDRLTTVIAVRQQAYEQGRTAILSSIASLVLFPATRKGFLKRLMPAIALGGVLLSAISGAFLLRRRRSNR